MRRPVLFLLLGFVLAASAAETEIWRWKDANGVTHYSDSPVPGAERVTSRAPRPSGTTPAPATQVEEFTAPPEATRVTYTRCAMVRPENDTTFFEVDSVAANITVEPALQSGDRVQVYLNGALYEGWPTNQMDGLFSNLYRGSYSVSVRVVDPNGVVRCTGPAMNFHIRQPSLLSPQRKRGG
jgi:hypothetical protein